MIQIRKLDVGDRAACTAVHAQAMERGNQEPAQVHELIWQTPEAYRALLGVLQRHKSQMSQVLWNAPPDDPLWHYAAHREAKVEWKPPLSARVVDVPAAPSLLKPPATPAGRCTVCIEDRMAQWNNGCWQLDVEE